MKIVATLTRCRHGQALVQLESTPFNGLEIRPADLRLMAQHLAAIADMANRLPMGGKHWKPSRVEIGSEAVQPSAQLKDDEVAAAFGELFGGKKA